MNDGFQGGARTAASSLMLVFTADNVHVVSGKRRDPLNRLMERVRIENGIVAQIESLDYGHNQP